MLVWGLLVDDVRSLFTDLESENSSLATGRDLDEEVSLVLVQGRRLPPSCPSTVSLPISKHPRKLYMQNAP